jgi:hypothetical protein
MMTALYAIHTADWMVGCAAACFSLAGLVVWWARGAR